jgi:hypothetical protein
VEDKVPGFISRKQRPRPLKLQKSSKEKEEVHAQRRAIVVIDSGTEEDLDH